jgi:hypothetical protein
VLESVGDRRRPSNTRLPPALGLPPELRNASDQVWVRQWFVQPRRFRRHWDAIAAHYGLVVERRDPIGKLPNRIEGWIAGTRVEIRRDTSDSASRAILWVHLTGLVPHRLRVRHRRRPPHEQVGVPPTVDVASKIVTTAQHGGAIVIDASDAAELAAWLTPARRSALVQLPRNVTIGRIRDQSHGLIASTGWDLEPDLRRLVETALALDGAGN